MGRSDRTIYSLIWMLLQTIVGRASGFLTQIVLALLLSPSDFGVISIAYSITNIINSILNVAIDDVILQRKNAIALWIGPAFWIGILLSSLTALITISVSPLVVHFYNAPELSGILGVLSAAMPLAALASVPTIILRSRMRYGIIAGLGTAEVLLQSIITVSFAYLGYGALSFVLPSPIVYAIKSLLLWSQVGIKFDMRPHFRRWKYLLNQTSALFSTRIIISLIAQGDYFILGLMATKDVVGVYYFAYKLAAQPLLLLANNVSLVILPTLVELKYNIKEQAKSALASATNLSFCIMPLAFIQAAVAEPLILVVFGEKWRSSIPIIQILSIGLAFDAVSWVVGSLLTARGHFSLLFRYMALQVPIFFAFIIIGGLSAQAIGIAWGVLAYYMITQPIYVWYIFRKSDAGIWRIIHIYFKPAAFAAIASCTSLGLTSIIFKTPYFLIQMFLISILTMAFYVALLRLFAVEIWHELHIKVWNFKRKAKSTSSSAA